MATVAAFDLARQFAPKSRQHPHEGLRSDTHVLNQLALAAERDWANLDEVSKYRLHTLVYKVRDASAQSGVRARLAELPARLRIALSNPDDVADFFVAYRRLESAVLNALEREDDDLQERLSSDIAEIEAHPDDGEVVSGGRIREYLRSL